MPALPRRALLSALALALVAPAARGAEPVCAAVFDLDFLDDSYEGQRDGPREDQARRLALVSDRVRELLAARGYAPVDLAPAREAIARAKPLVWCNGGCDLDIARSLGAEVAVSGFVHKVSNLILNVNLYVREVASGRTLSEGHADLRGNTDEAWLRAAAFVVRERIAPGARP